MGWGKFLLLFPLSAASQPAASVTPPSASASTAAASLPSSQELCEDSERPESDVSADQQDLAECPVYTPGDKQSRKDVDAWLQATYGVPFPDDFFLLWDFCCSLDSTNPRGEMPPWVLTLFVHVFVVANMIWAKPRKKVPSVLIFPKLLLLKPTWSIAI